MGIEKPLPKPFNPYPIPVIIAHPELNEKGIIVSRRVHPIYAIGGIDDLLEQLKISRVPAPFGRYQYFYESEKGIIDLITQPAGVYGPDYPEIFEICSGGHFFDEPRRFRSKEAAEQEIAQLLATK